MERVGGGLEEGKMILNLGPVPYLRPPAVSSRGHPFLTTSGVTCVVQQPSANQPPPPPPPIVSQVAPSVTPVHHLSLVVVGINSSRAKTCDRLARPLVSGNTGNHQLSGFGQFFRQK